MTIGMTKSNTKQKSIKLYPPVADRVAHLKITNFNYWANKIIADSLGISPAVIEAYSRTVKEDK